MKFANRVFPILVLGLLTGVLLLHAGCASTGYNGGGGGGGQTTVPATPVALMAAAGNAQVTLNWTGSSGATGYYVKRATTSGGPYTQIATQASASDTDTGLTNGTKYFYVVSAYNSVGQSANSAEVNATPVLPAPSAPTGLAATAGNAQVSLTWAASFRRVRLSREALDCQRGGDANFGAHFQQLHGYRAHQWHEIFLCGFCRELRRRERQLFRSFRYAQRSVDCSCDADGLASNGRQCASEPELEREHRRDELQREALDNQRRPVQHSSRVPHRNELHRHRRDQWHRLLLRRLRRKHRRRKAPIPRKPAPRPRAPPRT